MGDIKETLQGFLGAFSALDLEGMMGYWSEGASVFFPVNHHPTRVDGRSAVSEVFSQVLGRIRGAGLTGISLDAEDIKIRDYGDVALATFHVRDDELSRRTLVLRRAGDGWVIDHLHASNAPLQEGPL